MQRFAHFIIIALLSAHAASAAVLHGTVYDFDLTARHDAIVSVDSTPRQQVVAKEGTYAFTLPQGEYVLSARYGQDLSIQETIIIQEEGDYLLDLILLPDFEEDEQFLQEDIDIRDAELSEDRGIWQYLLLAFGLAALITAGAIYARSRGTQEHASRHAQRSAGGLDEDLRQILDLLQTEGGRMNQKDLRARVPHSEAKISLMVTDLESRGLVRKIKRGRGNIIVKQ